MKIKDSRPWASIYQITFSLVILSSLFRLVFLLVYRQQFTEIPYSFIALGFLHGLRFDLSTLSAFLLISASLLALSKWVRPIQSLLKFWIFIFSFLYLALLASDLLYFANSRQRLGYEVFAYLNKHGFAIFMTGFKTSRLAVIFGGIVFAWIAAKFAWKLRQRPGSAVAPLILTQILCVIVFRGGFQQIPLRVSDAFISKYPLVNQLAMNPLYLAVRSEGDSVQKFFQDDQAESTVLSVLKINKTNDDFPLIRCLPVSKKPKPKNVVVLLMESWTGKFISPEFTPEFWKLKSQGIYFDHFFATGYRTTSGVFSTLTGVPDQIGAPVMRRPESGFNYSSISRVLKTKGYYNIFIHGGALDFDNMQNLMTANDFDKMVGKDDFEPGEGIRSTWGIDDYSTLKRVIKELDQLYTDQPERPFFSFILSTTTHAPFDLYDPKSAAYKPDAQPEWQFLNSFRYSDWAIGKFFEMAKDKPWFVDTVFVLTADHTHHTNLNNDFDNQRVPLWIYSPKYLKPSISHHIGAHTDIASTVFQLVGAPFDATFGHNLLNEDPGFAYWMGSGYGWIEDRFLFTISKDGSRNNLMDYSRMDFQNDLEASNSSEANTFRKKVLSFAQFSDELIRHNKVAPDKFNNICK